MQTNSPQNQKSGSGFKYFIAALTLTASLGIWQLFSNQAIKESKGTVQDENPTQPVPDILSDLPPLPTLVTVQQVQQPVNQSSPQMVPDTNAPAPALRQVNAPTPTPQKAVIKEVVVPVQESSGGGGGGGGGSAGSSGSSRR